MLLPENLQRTGSKSYGLVQERPSSSALAMEQRLSCTNPSNYGCC